MLSRLTSVFGTGLATSAGLLVQACHTGCEHELLAAGTEFKVTVVSPSVECPEIVTLRAGDTLTLRAGPVSDDGNCRGNGSVGVPAEFPQYPASPITMGPCATGYTGNLGFACTATAPDCGGPAQTGGSVRAFVTRLPEGDAPVNGEYTVSVAAGGDTSCRSSCLTRIAITIQRL
jgi:hypothetical protein